MLPFRNQPKLATTSTWGYLYDWYHQQSQWNYFKRLLSQENFFNSPR